jgi:hypothetical protein
MHRPSEGRKRRRRRRSGQSQQQGEEYSGSETESDSDSDISEEMGRKYVTCRGQLLTVGREGNVQVGKAMISRLASFRMLHYKRELILDVKAKRDEDADLPTGKSMAPRRKHIQVNLKSQQILTKTKRVPQSGIINISPSPH